MDFVGNAEKDFNTGHIRLNCITNQHVLNLVIYFLSFCFDGSFN